MFNIIKKNNLIQNIALNISINLVFYSDFKQNFNTFNELSICQNSLIKKEGIRGEYFGTLIIRT
ncbi:hypothetical protein [Okeania sp. SIO2C2]|uniref:hypothetical protein n=1 Tax=Okeania sp. SIO2C2 TaxID=2607787 RepID=UPI00257E3637|nr:hypothetical protein [Okeania sp. SIO2C2]